jgi:CubicO group peptidase (beta-lactamase class C family)
MYRTVTHPWAALSFAVLTLLSPARAETATNLNEFEAEIVGTLAPRTIGFGYTIVQDGQVVRAGGGGAARPGAAFTEHTRVNVASVSKTITAVAMLQMLEKHGLTPAAPIGPWLPPDWSKGYGFWQVGGLKFHDLLTHRSGLQQTIAKLSVVQPAALEGLDTNSWAGLEQVVLNGVAADWAQTGCAEKNGDGGYEPGSPAANFGYFGVYCYKNVNYSLMRIMIARMWQALEPAIANIPLTAESTAGMYEATGVRL